MKYQHTPVIAPSRWGNEEKRFSQTIEKLFDEVYRRIGELSERIDKGGGYELPTASDTTKGGVKIGDGLTMTEEVLSANVQSVNGQTGSVTVAVPTKVSELDNDSGFLSNVPDMTGADGTNVGTHGLVPAPAATDNGKFLRGDGAWAKPATIKTLWENDSPSSNFAAQTITMSESLANFDMILVKWRITAEASNVFASWFFFDVSYNNVGIMRLFANAGGGTHGQVSRDMTVAANGTSVTVGAGYLGNSTTAANQRAIPVAICGVNLF